MATIIEIIVESDTGNKNRKIYYSITLEDNQSVRSVHNHGPVIADQSYDAIANAPAHAARVLQQQIDEEQLGLRAEQTGWRLHDDQGNFRTKKNFRWGTWDDQSAELIKYYLSLPDQLELINIAPDIAAISNGDMRAMLGITNQDVSSIRADIQVAIDTKLTLDTYTPRVDDDGNWIG